MSVSKLSFVVCVVVIAFVAGCAGSSGNPGASNDGGPMNGGDATVGPMDSGGADTSVHDSATGPTPDGASGSKDSGTDSASTSTSDAGADASDGAVAATPSALPCDIYGDAGTSCVAAHSTTRALYAAYSGRLYQVERASDNTRLNIGTLSPGGYADSAAQDTFCASTTCTITVIYDQSPQGNDLGISPGGGAAPNADVGAVATALPVIAGGHKVYGVYVIPGTGYRNLAAVGTATGGQPEGMYMVTSTNNTNNGCCFDYGNTEQPHATDNGNGHMDAVNFSTTCGQQPCTGNGPWVQADLENGLFGGNGSNLNNEPITSYTLVTAMLKNDGQAKFSLKSGNAQSGGLTSQWNGSLPSGTYTGYTPMSREGGIVLGLGGDNSNWSSGEFYEGLMTYGYPTDAADDAVQANIVAVNYQPATYTAVDPTSETSPQSWKYTTTAPAATWNQTAFDDSAWTTGNGGFGTAGTPGAVIGTTWSTADIWLRRTFNAGALTPAQLSDLVLRLHHDEGLEVYVNGVQAIALTGFVTSYGYYTMAAAAQNAVVPNGPNVIAAHGNNTVGGQYVDVGIYLFSL